MTRLRYLVFLLVPLFFLHDVSFGQFHDVLLAPYTTTLQYLNDQIMGDTTSGGTRRDTLARYVLVRGGLYLANGVIRNNGWAIRIKAQDSAGTRPVMFLYPTTTGLPPGQFINAGGNVSVKNLIMSGYFEPTPGNLSGLQGSLFDFAAQGYRIDLDSCLLTNTNGNHVRTSSAATVVKITNCIFANMGYLGRSNLGAGKAIDVRAGSCDSLIILNSTFVNYQDRIIRHFQSTVNIKYLRFEHNTVVNGMSYHGMFSLGRVGNRVIIKNNLFIDPFSLGQDTDAVRQAEFTDSGELDQFGFPRMTWIFSNPNDTTLWTIRNNFYYISPNCQSFWDSASILPIVANPPLVRGTPLTYHINSRIGSDSVTAFQPATVTLANIPSLMVQMMKWYRRPAASGGAGKTKTTTNWAAQFDYDRRGWQYWQDTLNCTFPTSNPMYTAAQGGYPVGDLNWWPSRKHSWELDPVSTVQPTPDVATTFALSQNYPNPFNPATKISFNLDKAGFTTLTVYNVLGQKVATLLAKDMTVGIHDVSFDASTMGTGVYFYRLESGKNLDVKKMMLLK